MISATCRLWKSCAGVLAVSLLACGCQMPPPSTGQPAKAGVAVASRASQGWQADRDRGQERYKKGDFQSALTYFQRWGAAQPNDWGPSHWLGWTYFNLGQYDNAIAALKQSNTIQEAPASHSGLGQSYLELGQYDDALSNFARWQQMEPKKVIVIADACHSGGVGQGFDVARRSGRGVGGITNAVSSGLQGLSKVSDGIVRYQRLE